MLGPALSEQAAGLASIFTLGQLGIPPLNPPAEPFSRGQADFLAADKFFLPLPHPPGARVRDRNSPKSIIPFWDYTTIGYMIQTSMVKSIYDKDYRKIIERLKKARIDAGLSQQVVADKLKKPQSYISKIESGERRLDVAEMKKLAIVYKRSVDYFLK